MNDKITDLLNAVPPDEFNSICKIAGIGKQTVTNWRFRSPRFDLLEAFAEAAGFEIMVKKKSNGKIRIIDANKRIEIFKDGHMIGYTDIDTIYAIDAKGYAQEIGEYNHRSEIIGKIADWRKKQKYD